MQMYNIFYQIAKSTLHHSKYVVDTNKDFFENQIGTQRYFDLVSKSEELTKSKEYYRWKSFSERFKKLFNTTTFGMYLFPFFSIAVGYSFVYPLFLPTFNNPIISIACSVAFLAFIEVAKNYSITEFMPLLRVNNGKVKGYMVVLVIIIVATSISSMFIGYHGAVSFVKSQDTIIKTVKTDFAVFKDSIYKTYATKIDSEQKKYDYVLANPGWQGRHTANQYKIMELCQANIVMYRGELADKIREIVSNEKQNTHKAQIQVDNSGLTYGIVVVLIETLILFSIFFNRYYKYRLIKDIADYESLKTEPEKYTNIDFEELSKPSFETPKQTTSQISKIGYNELSTETPKDKELDPVTSEPVEKRVIIKGFVKQNQSEEIKPITPLYRPPLIRSCKKCNNTFEIRALNQKFCGVDCRTLYYKDKHDGKEFNPKLYNSTK